MAGHFIDNRRISKNTVFLYFRMLILLIVSLFTSRITLHALGVDNYGIYNVVGGFVMMFGILTSSLTAAISRFITVELAADDSGRLKKVFSTSLSVQFIMSLLVAVLAEIIGIWFVFHKMSLPDGREWAAFGVLQCSILSFILSLVYVPFNSTIVAY